MTSQPFVLVYVARQSPRGLRSNLKGKPFRWSHDASAALCNFRPSQVGMLVYTVRCNVRAEEPSRLGLATERVGCVRCHEVCGKSDEPDLMDRE